ncbi:MAG TPA: IS110 family transposase [Pirellulales bacterium]|jgi:transposase|nr:IS110 family transposase [Pirellulales bacterium]
MTAITKADCTTSCPGTAHGTLYVALELGWTKWTLAMTTSMTTPPRLRTIAARDTAALLEELARGKRRFGLAADAPVATCYEAGRDGFWLHRWLVAHGVGNRVVDSSSIEVDRRFRRAKSDGLDVGKLLVKLLREAQGEPNVWRVVRPPRVADEDGRQLHRELLALRTESTRHVNRIKGLLASLGLEAEIDEQLPERLDGLRQWDGAPLPGELRARLVREHARWQLVARQAQDLENARNRLIRRDDAPQVELVRRLLELRAIGVNSSWLFVREFFGWRRIINRRELAALAGLCPTPYTSGDLQHEQGISKAGNRRMRMMLVEIAWGWLRWQPTSELSRWYARRFGSGNLRARKVGIVALARKLLVALWKYLDRGELPAGAVLMTWQQKVNGRVPAAMRNELQPAH